MLSSIISQSLGAGTAPAPVEEKIFGDTEWEYSVSTSVYLVRNDREYVNPTFTADRGWFHFESRFNYEAINTGSVWLGYNVSTGEQLVLEFTPMLGGVFGNSTGIAPGYAISATYKSIEFFTQGEYFFDSGKRSENFFYTWSELSLAPVSWLRAGIVVDRTKAFGSNFDIKRGPLLGFRLGKIDLTGYWLSPGSSEATFIFAATLNF